MTDSAESRPPESEDLGDEPTNTEAVNDSGVPAGHESRSESRSESGSESGSDTPAVSDPAPVPAVPGAAAPVAAESDLAAERLVDLQRLQAEYVNYKRRVDRDRAVVQERAVQSVLDALLPVLDDIAAARQHGDLAGSPFERIADKLEGSLGRFGLERFGEPGEAFDPARHEALMHTEWPTDGSLSADSSGTTVVQVLQSGYRSGEQVIRPARVSVADPA